MKDNIGNTKGNFEKQGTAPLTNKGHPVDLSLCQRSLRALFATNKKSLIWPDAWNSLTSFNDEEQKHMQT